MEAWEGLRPYRTCSVVLSHSARSEAFQVASWWLKQASRRRGGQRCW